MTVQLARVRKGHRWEDMAKVLYEGHKLERPAIVAGKCMDDFAKRDGFNGIIHHKWFSAEAMKKNDVSKNLKALYRD